MGPARDNPFPRSRLAALLFPSEPRDLPLRRALRTLLRTAHILATGVLLGGHIFDLPAPLLMPWLWAGVCSGLALLATDLHATFAILFEVRGLLVLLKLALVLAVPLWWEGRVWLLCGASVLGGIGSHMPGRMRYHLWALRTRLTSDRRSG